MTDVPLPQPDTPAHLLRPAWLDIVYGSSAGMISKVFEHPFDLVKVRLQSQPLDEPAKYKGPIDCLAQTFRGEGFRGLYRGLSMPVIGAMAENATLFVCYNQLQQMLSKAFPYDTNKQSTPVSHLATAAAGAGVITSLVLTPIELVKCRLQVQMISPSSLSPTGSKPPGPVGITRQIIADYGFKGLWLGQTGTLLRESGGGVAWFLAYEMTARALVRRRGPQASKADLTVAEQMLAGANAGVGYTVLLFPADSIKSTVQTAELLSPKGTKVKGFLRTGIDMYNSKGLKALYSGCGVTTIKSACSSALIFSIYAWLEKKFG